MAESTTAVSGLVSGLDTTTIISQLLQLDAAPQARLRSQVTAAQSQVTAFQSLQSTLAGLGSAANELRSAGAWQASTATSSASAVAVATAPGAATGRLTFDVTRLATGQTSVSGSTFAGTTATVAAGNLTVSTATGSTQVTPTDGSLASVVAAFNDVSAATGVRATAVQVSGGSFRLQLSSTRTGAASAFTVAGLADPQVEISAADDARLTVGAGSPGSYAVTSATNTFTGVLPGVTMTVSAPATAVTVAVTADANAVADKVQRLVDAANKVLTAVAGATAYDPSTKVGGPLLGQSSVRQLEQQVLSTVSSAVGGASTASGGVQLQRDGSLTFDRSAFLAAHGADPAATQRLFAASGEFAASQPMTGTITFLSAGARTAEGSHAVRIDRAASRSTATISGPFAVGQVITIGSASYTTTGAETLAELAAHLTAAAAGKGLGVGVAAAAGELHLTSAGFGAASAFEVTTSGGPAVSSLTPGVDVAGTIDGVPATGIGQVLSASVTGPLNGLSLQVTLSADDVGPGLDAGAVTYRRGLAQRLSSLVSAATDPVDGIITTAVAGRQSDISSMQTRISEWDVRLAARKASYQKTYSDLETALGRLRNQSTWLSGQLSSLGSSR